MLRSVRSPHERQIDVGPNMIPYAIQRGPVVRLKMGMLGSAWLLPHHRRVGSSVMIATTGKIATKKFRKITIIGCIATRC